MANNVYIGNRYVPLFDGAWVNNKTYDPLTIVTYGNNSYTSKKPVPLNTPPVNGGPNDPYWALTGNYNGQISALDGRITALERLVDEIPTNRKFILLGDSFSIGVIGGGTPQTTGWADYMYSKNPDNVFYAQSGEQILENSGAFIASNPWYNVFDWIVANKLGDTNPEEITDVVVLGGTNEPSNKAVQLMNYIAGTFVPHVKSVCPNAKIKIGCFGLNTMLMTSKQIVSGYRAGCAISGAEFIDDVLHLGTMTKYDSGYGHFTAAGYDAYNPWVMQAAITGHCRYQWTENHDLIIQTANVTMNGSVSFRLVCNVTNDRIRFRVEETSWGRGWNFINKISWSSGTIQNVALKLNAADKLYFPFRGGSPCASAWLMDTRDGGWIGPCKCALAGDNDNGWYIIFQGFINRGSGITYSVISFVWDGCNYVEPYLADTFA